MTIEEIRPLEILPGVRLRLTTLQDAAEFAESYVRNRDHLRRWDPRRPAEFFTEAGQRQRISGLLESLERGQSLPMAILAGERIAGMINLGAISMGPFRSAGMGYWVDVEHAGRGIATAAVEAVCRIGDERLGLHRIQADTLLDNAGSQRVLAKCGFEQIGVAKDYMHIDGCWQDLILHQRILNDRPAA